MKGYHADTDYRIGDSATSMSKLRDMKIPPPDQVVFQPAARYYVRGDFSRVGDGNATISWVWDTVVLYELAGLLEYLNGNDYAPVYINTDRRTGRYGKPSEAFAIYYATMWWPLLFGPEGTPIARSPYAVQTVRIQFVNATIVTGVYL